MWMNEAPKCAAGDTAGAWIDMLYYSCAETMEPGPFLKWETLGLQSTLTRSQSQGLEFLSGTSSFDWPSTPSSSPDSRALPNSEVPPGPPPVMHPNLVCTLKSILSPAAATDGDSQSSTSGDSSGSRCTKKSGVSGMVEGHEGSEMRRADGSAKESSPESTSWPRNRNAKQAEAVMVPLDWIHNRRPYQCASPGCPRTFKNPQTMRMHHKTHFQGAETGATPRRAAEPAVLLCSTGSTVRAGHNKKIPARCPTCCQTFVGLYELRRHFGRKHSEGEKRLACRKCAKRFHIEVDVRDHEKFCGEPIVCSGCGMKFAFKCNLVAHKRSRHPVLCQLVDVEETKERSFQQLEHRL